MPIPFWVETGLDDLGYFLMDQVGLINLSGLIWIFNRSYVHYNNYDALNIIRNYVYLTAILQLEHVPVVARDFVSHLWVTSII